MTVPEPMPGGLDSAGAVVRDGDRVLRPGGPNAAAVREFLGHLARTGFDAAPKVVGTARDGREILAYVPGDVAVPPFPEWAAATDLLLGVAALQKRLHEAAAGWAPAGGFGGWNGPRPPEGAGGDLMCHLDLCLENVVARAGRPVAFIDFDLAGPANRLYDIAVAARHWIPLRDPADIADARAGTDLVARWHAFADVHGLDGGRRARVADLLDLFLADALVSVREKAEAGHPGYRAMWDDGYAAMNARSRRWLRAVRGRLAER